MPLFVYISGRFSHRITRKNFVEKLLPLAECYGVFQLIYHFTDLTNNLGSLLTYPYAVLWYVVVLIIWRGVSIGLPYKHIRLWISLAFLAALLVGFVPFVGLKYTLSRLICFFPFFLLGYYGRFEHSSDMWTRSWPTILCVGVTLVGAIALGADFSNLLYDAESLSHPYPRFYGNRWPMLLLRSGIMAWAMVLSLAIYRSLPIWLSATLQGPARRIALRAGKNVLVILVYHVFLLNLGLSLGVHWIISLAVTLFICILLSQWRYQRFFTNPVSETLRLIRSR